MARRRKVGTLVNITDMQFGYQRGNCEGWLPALINMPTRYLLSEDDNILYDQVYLVQLLVRDLAAFISDWTYVATASYVFPNHTTEGVDTFYIPDNEPDFPGLEQVE